MVECVVPYAEGSTHGEWEHIMLAHDYVMTLFDGLNRFYVAAGETDLADALRAPASVIDLFEKSAIRDLNGAFHDLTTRLSELEQASAHQYADLTQPAARPVDTAGRQHRATTRAHHRTRPPRDRDRP